MPRWFWFWSTCLLAQLQWGFWGPVAAAAVHVLGAYLGGWYEAWRNDRG